MISFDTQTDELPDAPSGTGSERRSADRYQDDLAEAATDYFYKLSQDSNYIRRYRVKKGS